ncbi:CLUMA_CG004475, isoform A [Clunio marinus]|uniref:CLUMA_CG004475, isoform A n=1 Tax=Clunio marinus TaxID=568069 RepID=A0A1J1HRV4_9DIPT|nr:CLUMA_CG004475, isoform A [Clunio marinus]
MKTVCAILLIVCIYVVIETTARVLDENDVIELTQAHGSLLENAEYSNLASGHESLIKSNIKFNWKPVKSNSIKSKSSLNPHTLTFPNNFCRLRAKS